MGEKKKNDQFLILSTNYFLLSPTPWSFSSAPQETDYLGGQTSAAVGPAGQIETYKRGFRPLALVSAHLSCLRRPLIIGFPFLSFSLSSAFRSHEMNRKRVPFSFSLAQTFTSGAIRARAPLFEVVCTQADGRHCRASFRPVASEAQSSARLLIPPTLFSLPSPSDSKIFFLRSESACRHVHPLSRHLSLAPSPSSHRCWWLSSASPKQCCWCISATR